MYKVAIVGCGGIAQVHAWALSRIDGIVLSAFCDIERKKAISLAKQYVNDWKYEIYEDYKDLFDTDIDAVHICTPHYLHAPMALELLDHGKAVFMEKPCATSKEQFSALTEADKRNPGKLGFCFQNRYNKTTLMMDKLIAEGSIGRILGGRAFVTWRRDEDYYFCSEWKGRLATEGGGALINQSIHTLDLLLRYLGKPEIIKGSISNHHLLKTLEDNSSIHEHQDNGISSRKAFPIEVEDTVEAWMSFADGKRGCFYASNGYVTDSPVLIEIQGDSGRIMMNGTGITTWDKNNQVSHVECDEPEGIGKGYWGSGHKACIEDFYRCIEQGGEFRNSLKNVKTVFDAVLKIYEYGVKTDSW